MNTENKRNNVATPATATPAKQAITAENVQNLGERIAVKALKTCYQASGQPFIYKLYCELVGDIQRKNLAFPSGYKDDKGETHYTATEWATIRRIVTPLSDGYDIAQTATAFLSGYIGRTLEDKTTDGQTDKDGNPITILRACFRAVNRYIMGERQHDFKRQYVDDVDKDGNTLYYEIPQEWDTPTASDYKRVLELIQQLNLTPRQMQVLRYRLRGVAVEYAPRRKGDAPKDGKSIKTIAEKMGVNRRAVYNLLEKIREKAVAIGLFPDGFEV